MVRVHERHHTSVVEAVICQRGKAPHSILRGYFCYDCRTHLALLPHYKPPTRTPVVGRTRVVRLVKHIVAADDVVADIEIAAVDLHALGLA